MKASRVLTYKNVIGKMYEVAIKTGRPTYGEACGVYTHMVTTALFPKNTFNGTAF
jgi:hypothetical protein